MLLAKVTPSGMAVLHGVTGGSGSPLDAFAAGTEAQMAAGRQGVVGAIAEPLFRTYLIPFEITSVLLLAAAVGAVVLAKRKL
jgi:NADH:ubiquinone oxidoreductase subunit 6 (subunit J)